jgi:serine protease inhibitor
MNYKKKYSKTPQKNPRSIDNVLYEQMKPDMNNLMERMDMERTFLNPYQYVNKNIGEITGQGVNVMEIEKGMPLRGIVVDNNKFMKKMNPQLDFDLYDDNCSYDDEIEYTQAQSNIEFASVNEKTKLNDEYMNPYESYTYINNFMNMTLFLDMKKNTHENQRFAVSSYLILELLGTLFIASSGYTEKVLKSVFGDLDKRFILTLMHKNFQSLMKAKSISFHTIYSMTNAINLNQSLITNYNSYSRFIISDYKHKDYIQNLNHYFKKHSGFNIFPSNIQLRSRDLIAGQVAQLTPIFRFKPKNTEMINVKFYGKTNRVETLMTWNNKKFLSSGDNEFNLIEIDLMEPYLGMGFIMKKEYENIHITREVFDELIESLTPQKFSKIQIPIFSQEFDFSLIKQLTRMEIDDLDKADLRNLSPSSYVNIKDVFQRIIVDVKPVGHEPYTETSTITNRMEQNLLFKADHSFIYYLRFRPLNLILLMGVFD